MALGYNFPLSSANVSYQVFLLFHIHQYNLYSHSPTSPFNLMSFFKYSS